MTSRLILGMDSNINFKNLNSKVTKEKDTNTIKYFDLRSETVSNSSKSGNFNITFFDMKKKHKKTKTFNNYTMDFKGGNFCINLVDSPHVTKEHCFVENAIEYIKLSYDNYENKLSDFENLERKNCKSYELNNVVDGLSDNRIHLVLYCIYDVSNLKDDVESIKCLNSVTNVIPVFTKYIDNPDEIVQKKIALMDSLEKEKCKIFDVYRSINVSTNKFFLLILKLFFLKKINNKSQVINSLLGGKYGFCPPFYIPKNIESNNSLINDLKDSLKSNSDILKDYKEIYEDDFNRLFLIICCFIPFDCINKTQKIFWEYIKSKTTKESILKYCIMVCNNMFFY
jgi:hypothetical protein